MSHLPQFIAVIDSCSTVASDTQTKYDPWANVTKGWNFQIATYIQMIVPQTIRMSTVARGRFHIPN